VGKLPRLCLLLALAASPLTWGAAEDDGVAVTPRVPQEGITGLIVDDTVTFIGRQFYDAFAVAWLDQNVAGAENLSVHERPTAQSGSRVWVEHRRERLFQVFLPPTRANIEDTAKRAAVLVARRFKAMQIERALVRDPDLAPDEF
jgi:curli production assembly/transport component CsgE